MKIEKNKTFNFIELSEVKSHLRINQSFLNDDQYLNLLIKSATRIAEDFIADDIALTNVTINNIKIFMINILIYQQLIYRV
jgi:hypothetical protein